jgi:hypothetical protein
LSSFLIARTQVKAEDLRGPRIYSTDLFPSHFDANDPEGSVEVAARALKVKIITRGLVSLNSAYLVSPLAVLLFDKHPDLLAGPAILPAFREDKDSLHDLLPSNEEAVSYGIDRQRMDDHIDRLNGTITRVMPWVLGDVGERLRSLLIAGLANPEALIVRKLTANGLDAAAVARIVTDLERLPLDDSITLRTYIAGLPAGAQTPLRHFTAACYHMVGTGVVRCEAGTDLSPLSAFKAADLLLAGDSRPEMLSEEAVFTEAFMAFALDSIQAAALPSQILDSLDFTTVHKISAALREQGFQDKYDGIVRQYLSTAALPNGAEALASIEPDMISHVAVELGSSFQKSVIAELPHYSTQVQGEARAQLVRARADITKDFAAATPGLGNVISLADALTHSSKAVTAWQHARTVRDVQVALAEAHRARGEKISNAIAGLKVDEHRRSSLLDAVALLSDVHGIAVARA